ncbi:sigma-70 family RNA polymerase sigma factor [Gimesia aquarii]|uniref:RNA polymerase sigma factor SigM n=1 Tax=Gimesia aquarii TaxID=2527964 RepID=A0A517WPH2_9PLAN|nr:sigma-70 family RNA polymerase sigma factor [Gimesia aquarii]QDU07149.1 RNA polymerase sigma factor SigM [Gimesia aquarii]
MINCEQKLDPSEWVDAYSDYLYRYAFSRLRDVSAAEESLQETFLAGIKHQSQFQGLGSQRAWLLGILKRKIVDYIRSRSRLKQVSDHGHEAELENQLFDESGFWRQGAKRWAVEPRRRLESEELWQIVRECLSHIPEPQADAFMLSVMEEMSTEEICAELNITQSNLWVRLHRARLHLAHCVSSHWQADEKV